MLARVRFAHNWSYYRTNKAARKDLWASFLNVFVEWAREKGALSPKVAGKIIPMAVCLVSLLVLVACAFVLAWVGVIPNWKT